MIHFVARLFYCGEKKFKELEAMLSHPPSKLVEFLTTNPKPVSKLPELQVGDSLSYSDRNGVTYVVHTTKDGLRTEEDNTLQDAWFKTKNELLDAEFPDCPFHICLDDSELCMLDEPFTTEVTLTVIDDRACSEFFGFDEDDPRRQTLFSSIEVSQVDGRPITLRQILTRMIQTPSYAEIAQHTNHNFLECFVRDFSPRTYTSCFGS